MPWWADVLGAAAGLGATLLTGGTAASAVPYIVGGVTSLASGLGQEIEKSSQQKAAEREAERNKTMSIMEQYQQANQAQQDFYRQQNRPLSGLSLQRSVTPFVGAWNKPYLLSGRKEGLFEKQVPVFTDNNPWLSVLKWQNFPYGTPNPINQF